MKRKPQRERAFTLVEMMVAMTVLSMLALIVMQLVSLTSQAIGLNSKSLDAAGQARLVFDQIGRDLAARPNRSDLPMTFTKAAGNDSFQFYSQVPGYAGQRRLSVVGYTVLLNQLTRGVSGTDYTGTNNPIAAFGTGLTLAAPGNGDYEVLASGGFRLEFCYLLQPTTTSPTTALSNSNTSTGTTTSDYSGVAAIVVSLGILDTQTIKTVSPAQFNTLVTDLPDTANGSDALPTWNSAIAAGLANVPAIVSQNVHVYERTFYVQQDP